MRRENSSIKNSGSENRKILYQFTIIALLSGLFLIGLFYVVEMKYIEQSAAKAIEMAEKDGRYVGGKLPEAYTMYASYDDEEILNKTEYKLLDYYLEDREYIAEDEINKFEADGSKVFFTPAENDVESKDKALLIYTDVTFSENLVKKTVEILVIALGFITVGLFLVGNYFSKILDEKDENLKQFFANASHELKTPLMAIQGNADGMKYGYIKREIAYKVIDKEIARMTKLIGDILELSKLDTGMMNPRMEETNIKEVIYDAMSIVEPMAIQKNIEIKSNMPTKVIRSCDEEMLFSAISNILTNSIRYAESMISIDLIQEKNSRAKILIANDGKVLKEKDIKHIFDRFYKGDKGQSGIGLSLSQAYLKIQSGDIQVKIEDGKTIFEIVI